MSQIPDVSSDSDQSPVTAAQSKGLWGMSRPLLVEQSLQLSVPVLDTFFLSRVSDSAAAGAGAMTPVIFFCVNILWVTVFSGSSIASQRLGAGDREKALATIATYATWILVVGGMLGLLLYWSAPWVCSLMGLPGQIQTDAVTYIHAIAAIMLVWALKMIFQTILNIFGMPQWNMLANIVFFLCNILFCSAVVFQWFNLPPLGIEGVAYASVLAAIIGVLVSGFFVWSRLDLNLSWDSFVKEFRPASRHTLRIALPSMIEPMSFDLNMMVLNGFAAALGAAALAAKIYTFNTFLIGLVITLALTMATEILVCQFVGAGSYEKAARQMRQSLKAALWGSGIVVAILLAFHRPIMDIYTDDQWVISASFWLFLLAALSEPPRAVNVMVGGALRATGDGLLISIVGPLFTWIVAIPAAYLMVFVLHWGVFGILLSAILDEGVRSYFYWRRWKSNKWHHTHVYALESKVA
ncbi:MATE family efflux transporter [Cellvibrio zantedeschiae]|uniref:MATE family efflux transporter n=1 Tax=Cellvibrio zantedeschiae TaxID=1237077 RepID=A0ABQ3B0W1_9GAMM|nr:MATE family efflux transporter [Cellvibrio zantedeschiae]GGY74155.1 MATE family efflux transporter [Cellvibrio zantedeschiae]